MWSGEFHSCSPIVGIPTQVDTMAATSRVVTVARAHHMVRESSDQRVDSSRQSTDVTGVSRKLSMWGATTTRAHTELWRPHRKKHGGRFQHPASGQSSGRIVVMNLFGVDARKGWPSHPLLVLEKEGTALTTCRPTATIVVAAELQKTPRFPVKESKCGHTRSAREEVRWTG